MEGTLATTMDSGINRPLHLWTMMTKRLFRMVVLWFSAQSARWRRSMLTPGELSAGDGGIVVARRPRLRVASHPPGTSDTPGSASGVASPPKTGAVTQQKLDRCHTTKAGPPIEATKVVGTVQPVILPSDADIQCITAVLGGLSERTDVRGVVQELVNDSLLCLSRLHTWATVKVNGPDPLEPDAS